MKKVFLHVSSKEVPCLNYVSLATTFAYTNTTLSLNISEEALIYLPITFHPIHPGGGGLSSLIMVFME